MKFGSPKENSLASLDSKLVMIEIQARMGVGLDLQNIPSDPNRSDEEIISLIVQTFARGLRARSGPDATEALLKELQEKSRDEAVTTFLVRERVESLVEANRVEEAVTLARAAAAQRPDDARTKITLAIALSENEGTLVEANRLLSEAASERPKDANALSWLGEVENELGQSAEALAHFEAALSLSPDHSDAVIGLGRALTALGRDAEAKSRLESFLTLRDPYAGRVALALAKGVDEGDENQSQRSSLGIRALRFGAGQPAVDFLESIRPDSADPIPFESVPSQDS